MCPLSFEHINNDQSGFLGILLCLELRVGEERLCVYRALHGLPQVPDKTKPPSLITAEVEDVPAVRSAGSPHESPFTKAPCLL